MAKVTIKVINPQRQKVPNVSIHVGRENEVVSQFKFAGKTDEADGKCVIENLENGFYVFSIQPPARDVKNLLSPVKQIPPETLTLKLRMGNSCYYLAKRLRTLINKKEFDKAQRLIEDLKESYANYKEIPELAKVAELEKEIPGLIA